MTRKELDLRLKELDLMVEEAENKLKEVIETEKECLESMSGEELVAYFAHRGTVEVDWNVRPKAFKVINHFTTVILDDSGITIEGSTAVMHYKVISFAPRKVNNVYDLDAFDDLVEIFERGVKR